MVILGGLGTINGAFIGAAFILLFPVLLNSVGNNVFHGAIDATIISSIDTFLFFLIFWSSVWTNFSGADAPEDIPMVFELLISL